MKKYLFFTYGEPGWRGVQVRGLRVAGYLPKDEVLFWNGGDSQFISQASFEVETVDLSLAHPAKINLPKNVAVVVFCDIPTNEFFQFSLLNAAKSRGVAVVVLEQLYRLGQTHEFVYKTLIDFCDLFIFNGLSFQKEEESDKVKIVPPLVEFKPEGQVKQVLAKKWNLPATLPWFFGIGYKEEVMEKIKNLARSLKTAGFSFWFIGSGEVRERQELKEYHLTILPYQIGDDYYRFIKAAEVVFTKLGFLQIQEVLALGKPVVVLGGGGYLLQRKEVIDERIREVLTFAQRQDAAVNFCSQFLSDPDFKTDLLSKISSLHDGSLFGGQETARLIEEVPRKGTKKVKPLPRNIIILVNDELLSFKKAREQYFAYVLGFIMPTPVGPFIVKRPADEFLKEKIEGIIDADSGEILPHHFGEIYFFSPRKYDGLVEILPWYQDWVEDLEKKLDSADNIYISRESYQIFKNLLGEVERKIKFLV